ncbi:peptide-methionine (S)-S-oxide reductase MsrA [Clostridium sp. SM-530-WT-3G]|uniref:peptide-methionine (S)-S-oxide reductase MsrA n=1 Tax=Clostridium sp. SM-530-WT-3G TaxID=2725303 RepID=UPI00145CC3F7|nr:peptide-methionine (S)-S-oxide reductase MsrA [Clostridium sp. SM-530-WT-3G]NME81963.1 peptide-methionine (S)-S-oxide reductase MsrA [Clostridium sp. SM-530-WT-3G]
MKRIFFGGGCFWGIEKYFSMIKGVEKTEVGYANGNIKNPTYEDVCGDDTEFVEVCMVNYNSKEISLDKLLDKFWEVIDPTLVNRQGNDIGTQYRTGIYYEDKEDLSTIILSKRKVETFYKNRVVTEVKHLENYYPAEEEHQKYLEKNPNGYCHIKF